MLNEIPDEHEIQGNFTDFMKSVAQARQEGERDEGLKPWWGLGVETPWKIFSKND